MGGAVSVGGRNFPRVWAGRCVDGCKSLQGETDINILRNKIKYRAGGIFPHVWAGCCVDSCKSLQGETDINILRNSRNVIMQMWRDQASWIHHVICKGVAGLEGNLQSAVTVPAIYLQAIRR